MKKQTIDLTHLPPFQNHNEAVKVRIVSDNKILTGSIEWGHKKKLKTPKGPGVAPDVD